MTGGSVFITGGSVSGIPIVVPVVRPFHPGDVVHFSMSGGIIARHRFAIGRERICQSGRGIGNDSEPIDLPAWIAVALLEDGIDLTVSLFPIVLPAASRIAAETGNKSDETEKAKKSIHDRYR